MIFGLIVILNLIKTKVWGGGASPLSAPLDEILNVYIHVLCVMVCILGSFGKVFNLAIW